MRAVRRRHIGLNRVLRLMQKLEGCRYAPSLEVLADEFGVCERTIRRDLELLETAGLEPPRWRLNKTTGDWEEGAADGPR